MVDAVKSCSDLGVSEDVTEAIQSLLDYSFVNWLKSELSEGDKKCEEPNRLCVRSVKRLENSHLWVQYSDALNTIHSQRKRIHKCTPLANLRGGMPLTSLNLRSSVLPHSLKTQCNEVRLWYGTSPQAAQEITKYGFSRSSDDFHGIYLSECCSKSDENAICDEDPRYNGVHCLLLCRAVLGEVLSFTDTEPVRKRVKTGSSARAASPNGYAGDSDATPRSVSSAIELGSYDSVMHVREVETNVQRASSGHPPDTYREFGFSEATRVYPEYIVLYERSVRGVV